MSGAKDFARARPWRAAWNSPVLLLTATALIWAGHAVVSRLAVGEIAPMTLTFGRWAVALGPILLAARETLGAEFATLRAHWLYVSAMGAFGALMAVVLLGEPFAAYHAVALALVVGGVAIAQRAPRRRLAGADRRDLSTGKAD
jgi:drug/metabolite transporter (DMT)-like permease